MNPVPTTDTGPLLPYTETRRALQELLRARAARQGAGPPGPIVAVLGVSDLLSRPAEDTVAVHRRADVHLTPQAVLVGPWGPDPDARAPGGAPPACGLCLAIRWQRLRPQLLREALEGPGAPRAAGVWPVLTDHLVDTVWACYQAAYGEPRAAPAGGVARVTRIDLESPAVRTFELLPEALCPACSAADPERRDPEHARQAALALLCLRSRPRPAADTYRLCRPQDYALPAGALANEVCGALGPATAPHLGSPTTSPVAGRALVRSYSGLHELTWSGQANSFGLSRELAFLEGLERWAGNSPRTGLGSPVVDSYANLGDAALDPRDCGTYAPRTYAEDPHLKPFDPDRPIRWVWGCSLRDRRPILVPARIAYYGDGDPDDDFVFECSNGCAGGSCLEEAILFALLEVIERDAFLLGWYGRAALTELDVRDSTDRRLPVMIDRAALLGYDIRVFDNRIDLEVPVVTGLAIRRDGGPGLLSFAAGASLSPEGAVDAALSEILTYIPHLARSVATRTPELAAMARDFSLVRKLDDHAALFGLPEMAQHAEHYLTPRPTRPLGEVYADWARRRPRSRDLLDDVRFCRDVLVRAGHDVIVVDQTSAEQRRLGLRGVRAIVPGLLPIDFGWARQRALRMPRTRTALTRAGLRTDDLTEHDLHRVPHPFP
ncbi:TOMM precursor leader peptide-binding protein [Embleya sp. AB8]|uniref:TOMM precursor leader peptide-binding protein n=1 Tax=Embleya sp. AB8 TaxID=3156304 RepID=UPI003C77420D